MTLGILSDQGEGIKQASLVFQRNEMPEYKDFFKRV